MGATSQLRGPEYKWIRRCPSEAGQEPPPATFESSVWWPIPGFLGNPGCELGDAMEIRCPDRWEPGGYRKVPITFSPDGRPRAVVGMFSISLARIVAAVAYGTCPDGLLVRHLDDDVSNNHPSNLAYGTQADNIADSLRNGTFPIGMRNGRARLTEDDVREIRRLGGPVGVLARRFGVDRKSITNVLERATWKHVV